MTNKEFALVDDHGEVLGWYDNRSAAQADLEELGSSDDLAIIEVQQQPTTQDYRRAALNWLTRKVDHGYERVVARLHPKDDVRGKGR